MDKQTIKWLIIAVIIIGLIVVALLIAKAAKPRTKTITGGGGTQTPGLGNSLGNILGGVFQGNWWQNIFGGSFSLSDCDPNRPGYTKKGKKDTRCTTTNVSGYTLKGNCVNGCDDGNPGYDCDGFPSVNCGFS